MTTSNRWNTWRASLLAIAGIGLTACPGTIENREQFLGGGPMCGMAVDSVPSTIITARCATAGCHDSAGRSGGLDLGSPNVAARLVNVASSTCAGHTLVVPGDPSTSFFYQKLNPSPACGLQMPNGGTALTASEMACIHAWLLTLGGSPVDGGGSDAGDAGVDVPVVVDAGMDVPPMMDVRMVDVPVMMDVRRDVPVTMDVPMAMDVQSIDASVDVSPDVPADAGSTSTDTGATDAGNDDAG